MAERLEGLIDDAIEQTESCIRNMRVELTKLKPIHWCECGQPWLPAIGLYGTTEETQCPGCVLRRAKVELEKKLKRVEKDARDAVNLLMELTPMNLPGVTMAECGKVGKFIDEHTTKTINGVRMYDPDREEDPDVVRNAG